LAVLQAVCFAAPVILTDKGVAKATIVIGKTAAAPERFAAEELVEYIKSISGAELQIAEKAKGPSVILGTPESNTKVEQVKGKLKSLAEDGFVIKTSGENLILAGTNPRGVLYAVYTLLEDYLGVSWAQFDMLSETPDEVIPKNDSVTLGPIDKTWEPKFSYRAIQFSYRTDGSHIHGIDWITKNKMNTVLFYRFPFNSEFEKDAGYAANTQPEMEKRGLNLEVTHHGLHRWLGRSDELFAEHPECFPLIDGQRKQHVRQFAYCLSNPKTIELMANNMKTFIKNHPEIDIIDAWPDDSYGNCQCQKCRELGARDGRHAKNTDYYLRFVNELSKQVRSEYPDVVFSYLAYINVTQPPEKVAPAENVMILFCPYWRCFVHTLGDTTCARNKAKNFDNAIIGWAKFDNDLAIYAYYYGMGCYRQLPFPVFSIIKRDLNIYKSQGVTGFSPSVVQRPHELNIEVAAKLSWNLDLSTADILEDYCRRYFAQAAEPMERFYKRWEATTTTEAEERSLCTQLYWRIAARQWTAELFEDLEKHLKAAEAIGASEDTKKRIAHVRKYWYEYPRLAKLLADKYSAAVAANQQGKSAQVQKYKTELLELQDKIKTLGGSAGLTEKEFQALRQD
jgi:hypothetical protein